MEPIKRLVIGAVVTVLAYESLKRLMRQAGRDLLITDEPLEREGPDENGGDGGSTPSRRPPFRLDLTDEQRALLQYVYDANK